MPSLQAKAWGQWIYALSKCSAAQYILVWQYGGGGGGLCDRKRIGAGGRQVELKVCGCGIKHGGFVPGLKGHGQPHASEG